MRTTNDNEEFCFSVNLFSLSAAQRFLSEPSQQVHTDTGYPYEISVKSCPIIQAKKYTKEVRQIWFISCKYTFYFQHWLLVSIYCAQICCLVILVHGNGRTQLFI